MNTAVSTRCGDLVHQASSGSHGHSHSGTGAAAPKVRRLRKQGHSSCSFHSATHWLNYALWHLLACAAHRPLPQRAPPSPARLPSTLTSTSTLSSLLARSPRSNNTNSNKYSRRFLFFVEKMRAELLWRFANAPPGLPSKGQKQHRGKWMCSNLSKVTRSKRVEK